MITLVANKAVNNFLAILRNKETSCNDFRNALEIVSLGIAFELSSTIKSKQVKIASPIDEANCEMYDQEIILLPIIRAGLGMLNSFVKIFPNAIIEYQALNRTVSNYSVTGLYSSYDSINPQSKVIILDPMIATGGTLCNAVDSLKVNGAQDITIASVISATQGIEKVFTLFPEINIFTCALDEGLTSDSYIIPGLGDAGNRMNGIL